MCPYHKTQFSPFKNAEMEFPVHNTNRTLEIKYVISNHTKKKILKKGY